MSDRRPSKLYKRSGFRQGAVNYEHEEATPEDVIAELRRGVESGTIKGEVRKWCTVHRYTESHLYGDECEYAYHHRPMTLCRFVESTIVFGPVSDGGEDRP